MITSKDLRKNTKVGMNRQGLSSSPFFANRKNRVVWPTLRKAYMTEENIPVLKKFVTGKGRSIVFLDALYETKLNRYVRKDPWERAVSFEFMLRKKGVKGAIQALVWLGNFHNGNIAHFAPQFPQMQCWVEALGYERAMLFFEEGCFNIYKEIANILYSGNILDEEVKGFIENGDKFLQRAAVVDPVVSTKKIAQKRALNKLNARPVVRPLELETAA